MEVRLDARKEEVIKEKSKTASRAWKRERDKQKKQEKRETRRKK